jgi:hypothetical protein
MLTVWVDGGMVEFERLAADGADKGHNGSA